MREDAPSLPEGLRLFAESAVVWLLDCRTDGPCLECLRLWRAWRWQGRAEPTQGGADTALPVAKLMIGLQAACMADLAPLAGGDIARLRSLDLATGTARDHVLMRHPSCTVCPAPRATDLGVELTADNAAPLRARTIEDISRTALTVAVDSEVGIVRGITQRNDLRIAATSAARINSKGGPLHPEFGYGRSGERRIDPAIAAIEAIERFMGAEPGRRDDAIIAPFSAVAAQAIDPQLFILPDVSAVPAEGSRLKPYDPDVAMAWSKAYSFRRNAPVLIPRQLAYFGTNENDTPAGRILAEVSNGCAAGGSLPEAVFFGIMEVIERDAFLISWYSGRQLQRYAAMQSDDPIARAMLARLMAEGMVVSVVDIGCGLPGCSVAVIIEDREQILDAVLICAAANHIDPDRALRSALNEALTMKRADTPEEKARRRAQATQLLSEPHRVRTMEDHVTQGWSIEGADAKSLRLRDDIRPWSEFPRPQESGVSLAARLNHYIARLLDQAHDVLVVDQSLPPLAARGLFCVKVLVPGLLPMTFGHSNRRLDWARIARFADCPGDMHDSPHIFP